MSTTKNDRVVIEAKRAYRSSHQAQYDKLMAEQSRWLRKRTIANNKLETVRAAIEVMLERLVAEKDQSGKGE